MAAYRVIKNGLGALVIQEKVYDHLLDDGFYWKLRGHQGIESLDHAISLIEMYRKHDKEEELSNHFEVIYEVNSDDDI